MASHTRRYIKWLVVLMCLSVMVYIVYHGWRLRSKTIRVENISHYDSIRGFLLNENVKEIREITSNLGNDWRLLTESEYINLSKAMGRDYFFDLDENNRVPDKILIDVWGQRLLIAGRKLDGKKPEWIIWSKGPDGVSGTEDDLVSGGDIVFDKELKNLIGRKE